MTLIKYGCIFVSAGVIISGSLLWDRSRNNSVTGEDVAEILAARVERTDVGYLFGTNAPAFSSNNVVATWMEWDVLYGVLADAREMMADNAAAVYWLDPGVEISAGDTIAASDAQWVVSKIKNGVYTCTLTAASNVTALAHTTGSRLADTSSLWMPDVTEERAVMCEQFFPGAGFATNAFFGEHYNWWQAIGISSNIYKYGCEEWRNVGGDDISISLVGGAGFSNVVDSVHIPYAAGSASFEVTSSSTNTALLLASLYKVSATGRNDAYAVVSDADGAGTLNITLSANSLTVAEGESVTLNINPASNIDTVEHIRWKVIGSGVTTTYGYNSPLYWGGDNPAWNVPRPVTVTGVTDADKVDAAAIIRFERSSQPGVFQYVAVAVTDTDSGDADLVASPVLRVVGKEETADISLSVTAATNTYMLTDKRIVTNNLTEAKEVLESLRRSVVFLDHSDISYGSWIRYRYNASSDEAASGGSDVYGSYSFADAISAYNAAPKEISMVYSNTAAFDGRIMSVFVDMYVDDDKSESFDIGSSSYGMSSEYNLYVLDDCTLNYPSRYALMNGLVARLRVYLCVSAFVASRPSRPSYYTDVDSFSGSDNQPWFYDQFSYSSIYSALCNRYDGSSGFPADGYDNPKYLFTGSGIISYKLIEVVNQVSPSDVISFDIGSVLSGWDFGFSSKSDFVWYELTMDDSFSIASRSFYKHNNALQIERIIVVVDWNWRHCNPDQPFDPDENIPEWMQ